MSPMRAPPQTSIAIDKETKLRRRTAKMPAALPQSGLTPFRGDYWWSYGCNNPTSGSADYRNLTNVGRGWVGSVKAFRLTVDALAHLPKLFKPGQTGRLKQSLYKRPSDSSR